MEMDDYESTPQARMDLMAAKEADGFTIVRPTTRQLLLDLDTLEQKLQYRRILPMVERIFGAREVDRWTSQSGIGEHVVLELMEVVPAALRVVLQACLGSDPKRELLSAMRLHQEAADPIILFKPPAKTVAP